MSPVPEQWIRTASDRAAVAEGCTFDDTVPRRIETLAWNYLTRKTAAGGGVPFEFMPWFSDVIWRLFGWRMPDGSRRHWYAYLFVPRGNAKSSGLAGLLPLIPFVEPLPAGGELYVVSPTITQSAIVWNYLTEYLRPPSAAPSPLLSQGDIVVENFYRRMRFPKLGTMLSLKARENARSSKLDGFTGVGILEEFHGLDAATVDTVRESANKLPAPLLISISTAGRSKRGPAWEAFRHCREILDGKTVDIRTLPVIYAVPEGDGWMDFDAVSAANPGLGISHQPEVLRNTQQQAIAQPGLRPSFRQKNCNQWTEAASRWLSWEAWHACRADFDALDAATLRRLPCYLGVDLSARNDLCSIAAIWPDEADGVLYASTCFWLPDRKVEGKELRDEADYRDWARAGGVALLAGETVDLSYLARYIGAIADQGNLQVVGFDRKFAAYLMNGLQARGVECKIIFQGGRLADACKELETRIATRTIAHDGNGCMAYCVENVCLVKNADGGCYPAKEGESSPLRIDGVSALVIAIKTYLLAGGAPPPVSDADLAAARNHEAQAILKARA